MKKIISVLAIVLLITAALTACAGKSGKQEKSDSVQNNASTETLSVDTDEIIEEIITYHGNYDHEADAKVSQLLSDLEKADSRKGKLWSDIMDYWEYANSELEINLDRLPEDLPKDDSLAIVVLGYQLNADGSMQDELVGRLSVALACAQQYPDAYVICTGGGTAAGNKNVTEAGQMGQWMLESGIDEERLIIEDKSMTTAQNAEFSYNILLDKYPQVDSVAIVSSSYHIAWGSLLFEAAFMRSASENQTPEIHVISNCAYPIENDIYKTSEILRWQTGGMLQLIGDNALASQYYRNTFTKPQMP